jgi:hypothetical protein
MNILESSPNSSFKETFWNHPTVDLKNIHKKIKKTRMLFHLHVQQNQDKNA